MFADLSQTLSNGVISTQRDRAIDGKLKIKFIKIISGQMHIDREFLALTIDSQLGRYHQRYRMRRSKVRFTRSKAKVGNPRFWSLRQLLKTGQAIHSKTILSRKVKQSLAKFVTG